MYRVKLAGGSFYQTDTSPGIGTAVYIPCNNEQRIIAELRVFLRNAYHDSMVRQSHELARSVRNQENQKQQQQPTQGVREMPAPQQSLRNYSTSSFNQREAARSNAQSQHFQQQLSFQKEGHSLEDLLTLQRLRWEQISAEEDIRSLSAPRFTTVGRSDSFPSRHAHHHQQHSGSNHIVLPTNAQDQAQSQARQEEATRHLNPESPFRDHQQIGFGLPYPSSVDGLATITQNHQNHHNQQFMPSK